MSYRDVLGLRIVGLRYEARFIVLELDNRLELWVSADWEGGQVFVLRRTETVPLATGA